MPSTSYQTITSPTTGEYKDRGSKFIGWAIPVATEEEAKQYLEQLWKEHPKARHICYAFRIGNNNPLERSNDDGEPSGSAGKPILNQIYSAGVTNVLVAVVRYFGGTLLGVPGLIQAYKAAAIEALSTAAIVTHEVLAWYHLVCPYPTLHEVMNLLKKENVTIAEQEMHLDCRFKVAMHQLTAEKLNNELATITGVSVIFIAYA
ncbi:IMPACT family protein [soil metagenome]